MCDTENDHPGNGDKQIPFRSYLYEKFALEGWIVENRMNRRTRE